MRRATGSADGCDSPTAALSNALRGTAGAEPAKTESPQWKLIARHITSSSMELPASVGESPGRSAPDDSKAALIQACSLVDFLYCTSGTDGPFSRDLVLPFLCILKHSLAFLHNSQIAGQRLFCHRCWRLEHMIT